MSNTETAFPTVEANHFADYSSRGLTKREYFAAMAMQGMISAWGQHDVTSFLEIAQDAFKLADVMIKESEK